LIFGSDAILIPSEFNLKKDVKLDLARKKRNRLKTVDKNRALKIIIGFGGSDMILDRYIDVIQEKIFILYQRVNSVEISCFGQTSSKILKKLGLKHINIGWLDPVGLKKLYSQSDLYIGSIGYSMWERASMLVPSFVLPITDNQIPYLRVGEELNIHKDISSLDNNWNEIANELLNGAFDLNISCNAFTCFKDIDL